MATFDSSRSSVMSQYATDLHTTTENMEGSIFSGRYHKINKDFMRQVGIWPWQSRAMRIILPVTNILTTLSILIPEAARMVLTWDNMDIAIEAIPPMSVIVTSWIKVINSATKRSAMITIITGIEKDWEELACFPTSVAILSKYADQGRILTLLYAAIDYSAAAAYNGLPLVPIILNKIAPLNESRPMIYVFPTEYGFDPEKYYAFLLFHSILTTYTSMSIFVVVDTCLCCYIMHCCALFDIVSHNLTHILDKGDKDTSKIFPPEVTNEYERLCYCIKQHKHAITFANLIETAYSNSLVGIICMNVLVLSVCGVVFIIKMGDTSQAMRFGSFTIAVIYHLTFITFCGQSVINHSDKVCSCAYDCDWYAFSCRTQKLLSLIIARAQKPCCLTAGKLYVVNMENFSAVMRTSMSYFTVLCSFR